MAVTLGKQSVSLKVLIRRNWLDTEMRVRINEHKVHQYAEEMKYGDVFPEPIVFFDTRYERYYVGDGFHRILACRHNKKKSVEVELRKANGWTPSFATSKTIGSRRACRYRSGTWSGASSPS